MYNLESSYQNKQNLNESTTLEGYLDVKKLVTWPAIIEPSSNQKSNHRELQYMSILLALAYHGRATYETFTINRWILSSGEIWLELTLRFLLSGATTRQTYSFGSVLKLVTDLNWDQTIQASQISSTENTA